MSVANGAFTRTNSFGPGEERCWPRFHIATSEDRVASEREGRLICVDEERVELIFPGNPHTKPVFKVTQEYIQRFPKEYEAFKAGQTISAVGTPLEDWPRLKPGHIMELKHLGFRTVDDLAKMGDLDVQRIGMGGMALRNAALAFLDDAEAGALTSQLQAQNAKFESRNVELEAKVDQLSALVNQLHSELQTTKNAPNAIASYIPGMSDPVQIAQQNAPQAIASSSLNDFAAPKRRGRPPNAAKQPDAA
jgi:cell division protein FtsB